MSKTKQEKPEKFDSVGFMREVRERLSEEYTSDSKSFKKDLEKATSDFLKKQQKQTSIPKQNRA